METTTLRPNATKTQNEAPSPLPSLPTPSRFTELFLSLPGELYQLSTQQSIKPLLSTLALGTLAYYLAARLPWFSLPFVWVILGAIYVGLCAVALDCANNTFSRSRFVNELVGNIVSIPLLVPFHAWRVHLKQRNFEDVLHSMALGRSWWLSSMIEWLRSNFDVATVWSKGHRRLILVSIICIWSSAVIFFPMLVYYLGFWGLVKFWLMPWLVYHIWKSTFLQAAYRVPFTDQEITITIAFPTNDQRPPYGLPLIWNRYPAWVKLLSNDFAFLISASRIISHYLKEKAQQLVPTCNLEAAFRFVGLKNGYILDVENALEEEREKLMLLEEQKELDKIKAKLDFGPKLEDLPIMEWDTFKQIGKEKRLVVCDGIVFDLSKFYYDHPGGQQILDRFLGHDITAVFNGGVYNHSNGARNLARRLMIARIAGRPPRPVPQ